MDPLAFGTCTYTQAYVIISIVAIRTICCIDTQGFDCRAVPVELVVGAGVERADTQALEGVWVEESAVGTGLNTGLQGL